MKGWYYVAASNQRLGAKFNRAIEQATGHNPLAYVLIGSDDLLNVPYFRMARQATSAGTTYLRVGGLYIYDLPTNRMILLPNSMMGAGRIVHRSIVEELGSKLYPDSNAFGIDARLDEQVLPVAGDGADSIEGVGGVGIYIVDIKTDEPPGNIHSFSKWRQQYDAETTDGTTFMQEHFPLFELPA